MTSLWLSLLLLGVVARGAAGGAVLRVAYPGAQLGGGDTMYLRGEGGGLSWGRGVALSRESADVWSAEVPSQGPFVVKALVNDTLWQVGPNVLLNGTADATVYPWFGSETGRYEVSLRNLYSPHFDNYRDAVVYLPPGYDENPLRPEYPLVVAADGQNCFNASTSAFGVSWEMAQTLDDLVGRGVIEPVVVVAVYNTPKRILEYTPSVDPTYGGGGADAYLDWLDAVAMPAVRALGYRVDVASPSRVILGSSLGGLLSCYAALTRPASWSRAVCMSSSFWWNDQHFLRSVLARAPASLPAAVYLDSGHPGDDYNQTLAVRARLAQLGVAPLFYDCQPGGQHNEKSWAERFHLPMTDLFAAPQQDGGRPSSSSSSSSSSC